MVGSVRRLVVKVTVGTEAPERCSQAFTVATTAVAAGADVSVWLTGEAAWFALPGRTADLVLEHAAPLEQLLASCLAGGRVTLCTQCAARRGITEADMRRGIRVAGSAAFVEEVLSGDAQALVY
jgi:predicted peroxiredoxin